MITIVAFACAAAAGALARAEIGRRANRPGGLAWGTVIVNVTGSFALGLAHGIGRPLLTVLGVGGLGAYTTFSSFARDAVALVEFKRVAAAAFYVVVTLTLGIGAAALGIALSHQ